MKQKKDIKKVLIIGSGPIIAFCSHFKDEETDLESVNSTTPAHRRVRRCVSWATKSFWSIPTPQPS